MWCFVYCNKYKYYVVHVPPIKNKAPPLHPEVILARARPKQSDSARHNFKIADAVRQLGVQVAGRGGAIGRRALLRARRKCAYGACAKSLPRGGLCVLKGA